jgi:adenylate kinase
VGQLLRNLEDETLLAEMKSGKLVDDDFVMGLMSQAIAALSGSMAILDGYPRNKYQAEWIEAHHRAEDISCAIILDGDRENLIHRLMLRGREDDAEEVVRERFALFDREMGEILPVLERTGMKIATVDCVGTIEEVTERIVAELKELGLVVV